MAMTGPDLAFFFLPVSNRTKRSTALTADLNSLAEPWYFQTLLVVHLVS